MLRKIADLPLERAARAHRRKAASTLSDADGAEHGLPVGFGQV
jgi:hypothetical protein